MNKLTLNRITNYLMFATLCLFTAGCLYLFSVLLISRLQGNTPSPVIPWTTLQVGFVLIVIPFFGKRLFYKIVEAPEEVELPRGTGLFVGFLQGLLYGGTLLILVGTGLFCFDPMRLFDHNIFYWAIAALALTGFAGICYAPVRVARKTRLWLLLALIAQFVTISTIRQLLGLYPLKYDYQVEIADPEKMPLASKGIIELMIPEGAEDIHLYGIRGDQTRVKCQVTAEQLKAFAAKHKLELPQDDKEEIVFGNNEYTIFIYNRKSNTLTGLYKRNGLPEQLRRKAPADKQ